MVNLKTGRLLTEKAEVFNQRTFQFFLEEALSRVKEEKIILILDNAKWHHAKQIQTFVQKHSDRIELWFLPPYSPELNPIERVWKLTRKLVTHNRYFFTMHEMICDLLTQFFWWNIPNDTLKTLCASI